MSNKSNKSPKKTIKQTSFTEKIGAFFPRLMRDKRFRKGSAAIVITIAFIGITVMANLAAGLAAQKAPFLTIDMTAGGIYTLSDTTINLLDNLSEDVQIFIFASEEACKVTGLDMDPYGHIPMAYQLIKRYSEQSSHIKLIHADLARYPGYLDEFNEYREVLGLYSIAVTSARRTKITSFYEFLPSLSGSMAADDYTVDEAGSMCEMVISSLIKTVTIPKTPKVTYLDGMGDIGDASDLLNALYLNGYDTTSVDFRIEDIKPDSDMIILVSPDYDLTLTQWEKIERFLQGKNKTMLLLTSKIMPETPNLSSLLDEWGIGLTRNIVYETDPYLKLPGQSLSVFRATYGEGEAYTAPLAERGLYTGVDGPLEIKVPVSAKGSVMVGPILSSSKNAYALDVSVDFDTAQLSDSDKALRYIMVQSTKFADLDLENGEQATSAIIAAPLSLCYDSFFPGSGYGNRPLLLSVCNIRCGIANENLNIAAKSLTAADFSLSSSTISIITVIFMLVIPGIISVTGVIIFFRRRRL